jgi:hypothetical protein
LSLITFTVMFSVFVFSRSRADNCLFRLTVTYSPEPEEAISRDWGMGSNCPGAISSTLGHESRDTLSYTSSQRDVK